MLFHRHNACDLNITRIVQENILSIKVVATIMNAINIAGYGTFSVIKNHPPSTNVVDRIYVGAKIIEHGTAIFGAYGGVNNSLLHNNSLFQFFLQFAHFLDATNNNNIAHGTICTFF
jgi:hypothetical protein